MNRIIIFILLPFSLFAQSPKATWLEANSANRFINSLDDKQKSKAVFAIDDSVRYKWHYLPASSVSPPGIPLRELNNEQKELAYKLLRDFLSEAGYQKSKDIMSYEYLLKQLQPDNPSRIPENYFLSFYGNPAKDSPWSWKLTGHHLTLNFTIVDGKLAFAPFFFGVYPATIEAGPDKGKRLMKDAEDLGMQLINSLTKDQRQQAVFSESTFMDVATKNAAHTGPLPADGIIRKNLSHNQQLLLEKIIMSYLSVMPDEIAQMRMKHLLSENVGEIRFAWAGALEIGKPHYYRVQGSTFLIEFDNSQANANHIHTVWRDFNGDFGEDLLLEHYKQHHH